MSDLFKNAFLYIIGEMCNASLHMLHYIPGVQAAYDKAVARCTYMQKFVPDHFKTQKVCKKAVCMHSGRTI